LALLQLLLGAAFYVAQPLLRIPPDHPIAQGVAVLLAGILVAWFGWRRRGGPFSATYPFTGIPGRLIAAVVLTVAGLSILLSEADNALRTVLPPPAWLTEFFEQLSNGQHGVWAGAFVLVIAAPVAEELVFRGLILHGLLARYRVPTAILGAAVLFGLAHFNPWQFLGAVVFGVVAGWWVLRTGSLVPGLLGHALNNGLPTLLEAAGLRIEGYTSGLTANGQFQPLWFDALGVVLLCAGLWLTWRAFAAGFPVAAGAPPP
jgi:membrane protease YdiL (CAAX protease family)